MQHFLCCSADGLFAVLNYWEFTMVIYNAKEMAIVESKYVSAYYFPWLTCDYMEYGFVFGSGLLVLSVCGASFMASFMSPFMWNQ